MPFLAGVSKDQPSAPCARAVLATVLNYGKNETTEAEMSLINDYTIRVLHDQRHSELIARAAEERLARGVRVNPGPWWRRFVPQSVGTRRAVPGRAQIRGHHVAH